MSEGAPYAVLARKYRPQNFDALIGQEALVRVLTNAFARDRIPHAMLLTGVRGVGKTTTARIVAKGLNCSTADGPTVAPCGVCENCVAIAESRHVDVIEMDAASRTGIDDIREIIESVRYRANIGRYKVYIIDEVHMLSKSAFNGLLKTLEEPPPHVKFLLATTDAHKLPATVLSRCMRFDLRRVEPERMIAHLGGLCEAEGVTADAEALALVARASEGSVRDALSLLDQAIAHGAGDVQGAAVRDMLGLSDAGRVFELLGSILSGRVEEALTRLGELYRDGGEPASLLRELAGACHLVTVAKAAPVLADDPSLGPAERAMSVDLAARTPMRALSRLWQMILKAIEETETAPSALAAAEMAVIRMTYVAELPSPEQALKMLKEGGGASVGGAAGKGPENGGGDARPRLVASGGGAEASAAAPIPASARPERAPRPTEARAPEAVAAVGPRRFEEIVALIREKRDGKLLVDVERFVRPGPIGPCSFEFTPAEGAPTTLAATLSERLKRWTGARWVVSVAEGHRGPTLAETEAREAEARRAAALADPLVQAALEAFPGAELTDVREVGVGEEVGAEAEDALLAPYEDDFFAPGDWTPDPYGDAEDDPLADDD